jgi:hypothetical protein
MRKFLSFSPIDLCIREKSMQLTVDCLYSMVTLIVADYLGWLTK